LFTFYYFIITEVIPRIANNFKARLITEETAEIKEQQKETEELVLYLPLTDKQNDFTINDTEYSVKQSSEKLSEDNVDDVTQKLSTADDVTSKLINEIKKRDIIIKNLKENLKENFID